MTRLIHIFLVAIALFMLSTISQASQRERTFFAQQPIYICPMHSHIVKDHEGECPICGMDLVPKESGAVTMMEDVHTPRTMVSYICPMHSHIVKDHPGDCPICGMDLVEKANEQRQVAQISVTGAIQQAMSIRTEVVKRSTLETSIKTYGSVNFDETRLRHIHSRAPGWIERLTVNSIGQDIKKGQLLYEIYAPELLIAQEDFLSLLSSTRSEALLERGRRRLQLLGFADDLIKQLEESRLVFDRVPYYAQESGIVSALNVREGMYVEPAERIMTVANLASVWVIADVFEHQANLIKVDQAIQLTLPALGDNHFDGKIDFIYPTLDPITKTVRLRFVLDNPEARIKPDMLGQVNIVTDTIDDINIVKTALIQTEKHNRVIVQNENDAFEIRSVILGLSNHERVQILDGLSVGEKIVTSGQFLLDAEASLQNAFTQSNQHHH